MRRSRPQMAEAIAEFRLFNRFHTRLLGVFNRRPMGLPISLAEARVLYEISAEPGIPAAALADKLGMDCGQLSRVIGKLIKDGLVERLGEPGGRTPLPLKLSAKGKKYLKRLEAAADSQAAGLIGGLEERQNARLRGALAEVRALLGGLDTPNRAAVRIRPATCPELGWIVTRHGELYGREYGFGDDFALYVLKGLAEFADKDPANSRVWIADAGGALLGAVGIVDRGNGCAQMRWLLVEAQARGLGLGRRLVDTALQFCRERGYREIILWTVEQLTPARTMYKSMGFSVCEKKKGAMGGVPVVEEMWRLKLD